MPPATLDAFLDHGTVAATIEKNVEEAETQLRELATLGINLDEVTDELMRKGVKQFEDSFRGLMRTLEQKAT